MPPRKKVVRHKENPFTADMIVPVKQRQVQLSRLGADNNILINQSTGETQGTAVTTYRKVDGDRFVKLFTDNIGLTFDLTSPGIRTFGVLLWAVQHKAISKDQVDIDVYTLTDFLKANPQKKTMSKETLKRGLRELNDAQIIARTVKQGRFYINPNFIFNGDRIAFTTLIERSDSHNDNQQELEV